MSYQRLKPFKNNRSLLVPRSVYRSATPTLIGRSGRRYIYNAHDSIRMRMHAHKHAQTHAHTYTHYLSTMHLNINNGRGVYPPKANDAFLSPFSDFPLFSEYFGVWEIFSNMFPKM